MPIVKEDHPAIPTPPSDAILWRFMSVSKFLALLSSSELAFPQVALLRERDPLEGCVSKGHIDFADKVDSDEEFAMAVAQSYPGPRMDLEMVRKIEGRNGIVRQMTMSAQNSHYVSCWHVNEYEPAGLWSGYASEEDGVAIKSDFPSLQTALQNSERDIYAGLIEYKDYHVDKLDMANVFYPVFRKRREFESERELRLAMTHYPQAIEGDDAGEGSIEVPRVIFVPCNLNQLVTEIRVAPHGGPWVKDAIESVVAKYSLDVPVKESAIKESFGQ